MYDREIVTFSIMKTVPSSYMYTCICPRSLVSVSTTCRLVPEFFKLYLSDPDEHIYTVFKSRNLLPFPVTALAARL